MPNNNQLFGHLGYLVTNYLGIPSLAAPKSNLETYIQCRKMNVRLKSTCTFYTVRKVLKNQHIH